MAKHESPALVRTSLRLPAELHGRLKLAAINRRIENCPRVTMEQLAIQGIAEFLDGLESGESVFQPGMLKSPPNAKQLPEMDVSKDDVQFLVSVYEGIKQPMSLAQIIELLNLRK